MRVLKRNPDYSETDTAGLATQRIFKDHWQYPLLGVIPWDNILSGAVKQGRRMSSTGGGNAKWETCWWQAANLSKYVYKSPPAPDGFQTFYL